MQSASISSNVALIGMIMSQNLNPEVPCHRVIRADGKLGGYNRGGIEAKACILAREKEKNC